MPELGDAWAVPQLIRVRFSRATRSTNLPPRSVTNIGERITPKSPNPGRGDPRPPRSRAPSPLRPSGECAGNRGWSRCRRHECRTINAPLDHGIRTRERAPGRPGLGLGSSSFFALGHDHLVRPIEARAVTAEGPAGQAENRNRLAQRLYRPLVLARLAFQPDLFSDRLAFWLATSLAGWVLWPVGFLVGQVFARLAF